MVKQVSSAVPSIGALSGITDQAVRQALRPLIDTHNARNGTTNQGFVTRSELDRALAAFASRGSVAAQAVQAEDASGNPLDTKPKGYTKADLKRDLANGVESIVASAGPDYRLWVDSAGAKIEMGHKGVVYAGYSALADTTNTRLPALAITAGGIAMGYNDIDGNWVDAVAIEAATGNASFSGTINALYGNFAEGITIGSTGKTLGDLASSAGYSTADLEADLLAGVGSVLAGVGGDYRMWVDSTGGKLEFGHKNLSASGLGAGYSGTLRSGLVISATGIAAGYNRQSDGAWINALAISSTGNVTIAGTLKASSIIEAGATVSGYGTIGGVATTANDAYTLAASKLSSSSSYVLTGAVTVQDSGGVKAGTVTWDATTGAVTGGTGVVFTENGIVGVKSGVTTFAVTNAGDASFAGTIDTGGDARFYGATTATQNFLIGGTVYKVDYSCFGFASSDPALSTSIRAGVVGYAPASVGAAVVGLLGRAPSTTLGIGCAADGGYRGGYFSTSNASGIGVIAHNTAGGVGLSVIGTMQINNTTLVSNLNADLLDGNHASAFATAGHTHSGYVSVASGRSSGDYIYAVDFSAPSNPTTRAGWVRVTTNAGGGGVWLPYYT